MTDIWSFLLQTLTASGVAALLLAVKAMFRDKLPPRWQFAVWGVLALALLFPAGWGGRYVLVNWPVFVEAARSALTGEFGVSTHVAAPVPLPSLAAPRSVADVLYLIYLAGAAALMVRYVTSYIRLRLALRQGRPAQAGRVRAVAERYGLPVCPAVEVNGLPTAFVCGVFRPVLALPGGVETDEKVILHELLHLKHMDVLWGLVICFFRCIHWCDPLLWFCADLAGNDLESLCDQRVLERLEGEERRDYGRILLSMADERYARTPGTSSAANGGENIRRRIEAIARFKRYPAGMTLVSVCVVLVLAVPLTVGARAETVKESVTWFEPYFGHSTTWLAAARTVYCTTYAGAFDTYAKAVIQESAVYRAMCAPLAEQDGLAAAKDLGWGSWDPGLPLPAMRQSGYEIYDLSPLEDGAWEGVLVVALPSEEGYAHRNIRMGIQSVRVEKEGARWVAIPQEEFRMVSTSNGDLSAFPCVGLPAKVYEAQAGDWTLQVRYQTAAHVDSSTYQEDWFQSYTVFDTTPKPHGTFDSARQSSELWAVYTGDQRDKEGYDRIGASVRPMWEGDTRPVLEQPARHGSGSSSSGSTWGGKPLSGDQGDEVFLSGGGGGISGDVKDEKYLYPDCYAADLYLNGGPAVGLTLLPVEGGVWVEY